MLPLLVRYIIVLTQSNVTKRFQKDKDVTASKPGILSHGISFLAVRVTSWVGE
jgi:hypothetical protein